MVSVGAVFAVLSILVLSCKKEQLDQHKNFDRKEMLTHMADHVILGRLYQFYEATQVLETQTTQFTQNPTASKLLALQDQWKTTIEAWKLCEPYDIGKVQESFLYNKIDMWPTKVEFIQNNLNATDLISNPYIESKGSSSKGLPAMEWFLFSNGEDSTILDRYTTSNNKERNKAYVLALSQNIKEKSLEVINIWQVQGYRTIFINATGSDLESSVSILTNEIINLTERVMQMKVGKPAGITAIAADTLLVEHPYAHYSLKSIEKNVQSLKEAFFGIDVDGTDGLGLDDYLNELKAQYNDTIALPNQISLQFKRIEESVGDLENTLSYDIIHNPDKVEKLYSELQKLLVLFKADVSSSLSITVTFNDNDGD